MLKNSIWPSGRGDAAQIGHRAKLMAHDSHTVWPHTIVYAWWLHMVYSQQHIGHCVGGISIQS